MKIKVKEKNNEEIIHQDEISKVNITITETLTIKVNKTRILNKRSKKKKQDKVVKKIQERRIRDHHLQHTVDDESQGVLSIELKAVDAIHGQEKE